MTEEKKCLRCGSCCFVKDGDKVYRCRYLKDLPDGTYLCSIYSRRLGKRMSSNYKCGLIQYSSFDYEKCPFNKGKPLVHHKEEYYERLNLGKTN